MEGTSFCVLASGSTGNCSVLSIGRAGGRDIYLIDAGLSPRRTFADLRLVGVDPGEVRGVLLTHLDRDHWHPGWAHKLPAGAFIAASARHARSGRRAGILPPTVRPFDAPFALGDGAMAHPISLSHDAHGVAAFRIDFGRGSLGFATDLGRVPEALVQHFRGVEVLAIESNYCPRLQHASGRPDYLKRRIMGGSGHLSNQECLAAVEGIAPRDHVVFLHLSRECNHPDLVGSMHAGAEYAITISTHERPTRWVRIEGGAPRSRPAQPSLFAGLAS